MEKRFIITFSNGYCGCEIEEEFIGTLEEAEEFAQDYLPDYAESYAYCAFGWFGDYSDEDYEEYIAGCSYDIEEEDV